MFTERFVARRAFCVIFCLFIEHSWFLCYFPIQFAVLLFAVSILEVSDMGTPGTPGSVEPGQFLVHRPPEVLAQREGTGELHWFVLESLKDGALVYI